MKTHLMGKRGIVCGADTKRFTKVPSLVDCRACLYHPAMATAEAEYAQQPRRNR